jgi:PAS domain S-box-containing protein
MQEKDKRTESDFDAAAAMESLFTSSGQAMALLDCNLRFKRVNQRFADLQQCRIDEIVGLTTRDLWPARHHLIDPQLQQVIATSKPTSEIPLNYSPVDDPAIRVSVLASYVPLLSAGVVSGVGIIAQVVTDHARMQALQQETMERFNYLALATNDGIWDFDLVKRKHWWNPRLYELLGYRVGVDEATSDNFVARLHPDEQQQIRTGFRTSLRNTFSTWQRSFRLMLPDGTVRHVMDRAYFLRDEHGNLHRAIGAVTDLSDMKRAEDALVASQLRFQLAASTGGIWDWREDSGTFLSPRFLELLGYPSGERQITTQEWLAFVHPEDQPRVINGMRSHVRDRHPYQDEYRMRVASGDYRWFQVAGQAVWNAEGRATYMAGSITDITTRKQVEQELRASEERYRLLIESSPDAVLVHRDEMLLYVNRAAALMLGYSSNTELIGQSVRMILPPTEEQHSRSQRMLDQGMRGILPPLDARLMRADGTVLYVETTAAIVNFEGRPAAQSVCRDISERRRVQEEVHRLNETLEHRVRDRTAQLQAANQELESFSYSVSHDLRAPLRHMSAYATLLSEKPAVADDPQSLQQARSIIRAAARLGQLVDDLLMFSRMGRAQLNYSTFSTQTLVEHVRRELEGDIEGRVIDWRIQHLPDVLGDAPMLQQVWTNLMSNAIKYTRPRAAARVEIGADISETEIIFFVRDNGVGFDTRYADKLFGVFERLHSVQEFEGTGIGLANVRRIVQRHGGRVWADAVLDEGATFFFALPQQGTGDRLQATGQTGTK